MNIALRDQLTELAHEDQKVRVELAADGSLLQGYHPRMREVHEHNAAVLAAIIEEHGWPGRSLVGEEGARAAWLILQHAIGNPPLQRHGLQLLKDAAARGDVPLIEVAMLEDRIRVFEGRPQVYGTQYDWDEHGVISPYAIEDEANVDERRRSVGLGSLAENTARVRADTSGAGEKIPVDWAKRRQEMAAWARSVGWRA